MVSVLLSSVGPVTVSVDSELVLLWQLSLPVIAVVVAVAASVDVDDVINATVAVVLLLLLPLLVLPPGTRAYASVCGHCCHPTESFRKLVPLFRDVPSL